MSAPEETEPEDLPPFDPWSGGAPTEEELKRPKAILPPLGHDVPLYRTDDLTRHEWVKARKHGKKVGASHVAAIMQRHPYASPITAWGDITGRTTWESEDEDERFRMDLGIVVEPQIRRAAANALGVEYVEDVDFRHDDCMTPWPQVLQHPRLSMFTCNLDATAFIQGEKMAAECKWGSWRSREHWYEFRDTLDPRSVVGTLVFAYYLQVQAQLSVTGLRRGILIGILGEEAATRMLLTVATGVEAPYRPKERDIVVVYVDRDEEIITSIESVVPRFYERYIVTGKVPPVMDNRDLAALREAYIEANPPKATIDRPDLEHWANRYMEIGKKLSQGNRLQDDARSHILVAFVEDGIKSCTAGRYIITYNTDKRGQRTLRVNERKD